MKDCDLTPAAGNPRTKEVILWEKKRKANTKRKLKKKYPAS